ncbi:VOC family protein [Streptococcus halichoeri]|uniref:VOC family protein n=2 Tax=Streptococcus halichoeri TaxID=254785 RepID=UPI001C8D4FB9|nr:VOC family protein [Streptococcus halichoeri]
MIQKSTTMLYMKDPKAAADFWCQKVGFLLIEETPMGETRSYQIAPSLDASFSFGIHDQQLVAAQNPELNLGFPSVLLETDDLQSTHAKLTKAGVKTNPIMDFQGMVHFTFVDTENHYIAVRQAPTKKEN